MAVGKIILATILGYSAIVSAVIIICINFDCDEENLLIFATGPIFWILFLISGLKNKEYIYSYESYERFKDVEWPMFKFGKVLLIRNRKNTKFSLWDVKILSKKKKPKVATIISIEELRKKEK